MNASWIRILSTLVPLIWSSHNPTQSSLFALLSLHGVRNFLKFEPSAKTGKQVWSMGERRVRINSCNHGRNIWNQNMMRIFFQRYARQRQNVIDAHTGTSSTATSVVGTLEWRTAQTAWAKRKKENFYEYSDVNTTSTTICKCVLSDLTPNRPYLQPVPPPRWSPMHTLLEWALVYENGKQALSAR